MTNKLVVIINSLKVTKIKKILLYELKFLVPNYSRLQNPRLGGYRPQIPFVSVLCPELNWLNPPPPNKIPGYATVVLPLFLRNPCIHFVTIECSSVGVSWTYQGSSVSFTISTVASQSKAYIILVKTSLSFDNVFTSSMPWLAVKLPRIGRAVLR